MSKIKPMKAHIPESLLNKIIDLEKRLDLPEETIIQTALVIGISELRTWTIEDE